MKWSEFEAAAPDLAARGRERFEATGLALVGTIRKDGTPRISPLEPLIADGELYLGMMWQSRKALDLLRDPRCVVHSTVSKPDASEGEFKLWARVRDVQNPQERERCADAYEAKIQWRPTEPYHLFAADIESASFIQSTGEEQFVMRWRAGGKLVTATRRWAGSGYAG
ncbi:MAG: pyridoxamine 5'-phosphate oxidase family protein [Dehalococcoidia bacterium]